MSDVITASTRGHVRLIGLNRPAKRNAFDSAMLRDLAAALSEADRDPEVRASVLFAHGDHFTGGLDLPQVGPRIAARGVSRGASVRADDEVPAAPGKIP